MKHFCKAASLLLILVVFVLYLPLTLPRIFGYECSSVVSASMEPAIQMGGLVYYTKCEPAALNAGDIIVFRTSYGTGVSDITHRVVENNRAEGTVTTKGDANGNNDFAPIRYDLIKGKVAKALPFGGELALRLTAQSGKRAMACLLIPAVLLHFAAQPVDERKTSKSAGTQC